MSKLLFTRKYYFLDIYWNIPNWNSFWNIITWGSTNIKKFPIVFIFFLVFAARNWNPWLQKSGNGVGQSEQILKFIDFQLFPVLPTAYLHKLTTIPQKTFEFVLVRLCPVAESLCQRWCKIKSRASSTLIEVQLYCGSLDCAVLLQYRCNLLQILLNSFDWILLWFVMKHCWLVLL